MTGQLGGDVIDRLSVKPITIIKVMNVQKIITTVSLKRNLPLIYVHIYQSVIEIGL